MIVAFLLFFCSAMVSFLLGVVATYGLTISAWPDPVTLLGVLIGCSIAAALLLLGVTRVGPRS